MFCRKVDMLKKSNGTPLISQNLYETYRKKALLPILIDRIGHDKRYGKLSPGEFVRRGYGGGRMKRIFVVFS